MDQRRRSIVRVWSLELLWGLDTKEEEEEVSKNLVKTIEQGDRKHITWFFFHIAGNYTEILKALRASPSIRELRNDLTQIIFEIFRKAITGLCEDNDENRHVCKMMLFIFLFPDAAIRQRAIMMYLEGRKSIVTRPNKKEKEDKPAPNQKAQKRAQNCLAAESKRTV